MKKVITVSNYNDPNLIIYPDGLYIYMGSNEEILSGVGPAQVTLLAPANKSLGISTDPILGWAKPTGGVTYELKILASDLTTIVKDITGITNTQYGVTGLSKNTGYIWLVRAFDSLGNPGVWSAKWAFATVASLSDILVFNVNNTPLFDSATLKQIAVKQDFSFAVTPAVYPGPP